MPIIDLAPPARPRGLRRRCTALESTDVLVGVLALAVVAHALVPAVWQVPTVALGVAVSVVVSLVPSSWLHRVLPRRRVLAVPVAALAGCALPGCECGSVPVASAMLRPGIPAGPAFSLMLSAPATSTGRGRARA